VLDSLFIAQLIGKLRVASIPQSNMPKPELQWRWFVLMECRAVTRKTDKEESDGPFAGQYWIVGGKWNWVDTFSEFIRTKAIGELFNGNFNRDELYVPEGFIGGMPIMVGWSAGENSPYGLPGVSWQCCYQVIFKNRIRKEMFKLDENHEDYVFIRPGDHLAHLHPYVRDVIQMSGWLTQKHS
jgi:hypothetical protein